MEAKAENESLLAEEVTVYFDQSERGGILPPFSENTYFLLDIAFRGFIQGPFALSGVVSNVINIVMFYRQGFLSHSSVVNLTALAITDFLTCLFCVWGAVCGFLDHFVDTSTWSWVVHLFFVFTVCRPVNTITQITCWITAFLAFERAISVVFPFKAKSIFTPKRSLIIMICIFVVTTIVNTPNLMSAYPTWTLDERTNRTYVTWRNYQFILGLFEDIFFYTSPVTLRFLSVVVVVVCNIIIFWKVYLSQRFRKMSASLNKSTENTQSRNHFSKSNVHSKTGEENEEQQNSRNKNTAASSSSTTKEMRLVRMITLISSVFIVCYIPSVLHVIIYYIVWDWNVHYHWWVDIVVWNVVTSLQIISASTNIFIYFNMSTRYREEFLLCLGKKRK